MKSMKVKSAAFALVLSLGLTASNLQPRQADAYMGLALIAAPVAVMGAAFLGVGAAELAIGVRMDQEMTHASPASIIGLSGLGLGLLLLDQSGQPAMKYVALDAEQASKLGLSDSEMSAYNDSLDEINAVAETVSSDMVQAGKVSLGFARDCWSAYRDTLGADAFGGVQKVSTAFARQVAAKN